MQLETFELKGVNSKTISIKWVYSDCIHATILDLEDLGWHPENMPNNPINFDSNRPEINTHKLITLSTI